MSPVPHLIHPVEIRIKRIDRGGTVMDDDAREPVQQAEHFDLFSLPGQPNWDSTIELKTTRGGRDEDAHGYVIFRKVDMDAMSYVPALDDRIVSMGWIDTDLYITRIEWKAHYPDQLGPTLCKAYLNDRCPAKLPPPTPR